MKYTAKRDYFKENVENELKTLIQNPYGMLLMSLVCLPKRNITSSSIGLKIDDKVSFDRRTIAEK